MFKKLSMLLTVIAVSAGVLYAGDTIVNLGSVEVSTKAAVMVLGYKPSRKMSACYNDDATYAVYVTTFLPVSTEAALAEVVANGNYIPINAGSSSRDEFYVYKSSWYVTGSTDAITGKVFYLEKE